MLVDQRGTAELVIIICGFVTLSDLFHLTHSFVVFNGKLIYLPSLLFGVFCIHCSHKRVSQIETEIVAENTEGIVHSRQITTSTRTISITETKQPADFKST